MASDRIPPAAPPPTLDFGGEEQAEKLVALLDQYLADLKAGKPVDRAQLLAAHPELADQLAACLAGLEFIQGVESTAGGRGDGPVAADAAGRRTLGDFRILREVGRGGMGAVYEAEQVSLGRRVALKVLRFGGVSDPEALDRFHREAETVARLHHTNIVPIFAVGSEHGVNFYAMQFIDGKSLAEVAADAARPLDADDVTRWGLQAAEALAHAHDRHVIHRDVKPSNLLLDADGRIWLTDFGLALRLDDVTLSMTGALLGTPRYMSPEQASAVRRQVDRRTDIYSLGATLYELLAGRPAFSGETPHQVIQQILSVEPTPLRQIRPDLPRDLETVVMKCLAKDPQRRYLSARELADDLRACAERRPIRARRAGLVELAGMWLRAQKQGVRISTYAAAATLVVVLGVLTGLRWYDGYRTATITLATPTPPLTSEFLGPGDEVAVSATVPTEEPLTLRDGEYRIRTSSVDRWSQTFRTRLDRGAALKRSVNIDDQQLWMPTAIPRWWSLVDDDDSASLLAWSDEGVACEGGAPKRPRWKTELTASRHPALAAIPGWTWPWLPLASDGSFVTGATDRSPLAASRTVDLNGDGHGDFLIALRHQAALLAISGRDGTVLWCAARSEDLHAPPPEGDQNHEKYFLRSALVGAPQIAPDADDDGVPDVLITRWDAGREFQSYPKTELRDDLRAARRVELVSGASGTTIWEHRLEDDWFELNPAGTVPEEFQAYVGRSLGYSSGMVGGDLTLRRQYIRSGRQRIQKHGQHVYAPEPARIAQLDGESRVLVVAGRRCEWLAARSGEVFRAGTLDARPAQPGRWADLDADGRPEFVFLEMIPPAAAGPAPAAFPAARLIAWSVVENRRLWSDDLEARVPWRDSWTIPSPSWPLVEDLDGDGAAEVISPDDSSYVRSIASFVEVPWGEVAVRDGRTGEVRWKRRVVISDQQLDRLAVGPDLDGDGVREIFAAGLANMPIRLHVEARSGRTGELLWLASHSVRANSRMMDRRVGELVWWNAGEDGGPLLLVSVHHNSVSPMESDAWLLSARDGSVVRKRRQVGEVVSRDVDRDGVEDLVTYQPHELAHPEDGGRLDCLRGVASEPWNSLGLVGAPADDFDGDGVRDLLGADSERRIVAISGLDGRILWTCRTPGPYDYHARSLAEPDRLDASVGLAGRRDGGDRTPGDVDGDGVADVLIWLRRHFGHSAAPLLGLISGRTGEILWRSSDLTVLIVDELRGYRLTDVDGDGRAELVVSAVADVGYSTRRQARSNDELQLGLYVLSAQTGRLRWRTALSPAFGNAAPPDAEAAPPGMNASVLRTYGAFGHSLATGDLDGDRIADIVVPALGRSAKRGEYRAYRGRDGAHLWTYELPPLTPSANGIISSRAARIVDVDGDGRAEACLLERDPSSAPRFSNDALVRICVLDGTTGAPRWKHDAAMTRDDDFELGPGTRRRTSELILLRTGEGGIAPAVFCCGDKPLLLVALRGAERVATTLAQPNWSSVILPIDADGDGADELAFVHEHQVRLVTPRDLERPVWTAGSPEASFDRLLDVRSDSQGKPVQLVAQRATGDGSVAGLDATTGRIAWIAAAPIAREGKGYVLPTRVERLDDARQGADVPPFVLFETGEFVHVRRGAAPPATFDSAAAQRPPGTSRIAAIAGGKPPLRPVVDRRWGRSLPWVLYAGAKMETPLFLRRAAVYGLLLVVLPWNYVTWIVRRRRWGLKTLLLAPALVGMMIVVSTTTAFDAGDTEPGTRWLFALGVSPLLVFLARLVLWPFRGEWRRSVRWILIIVGLSAVLGGLQIAMDLRARVYDPAEYYVWDDWHFVFDQGIIAGSYGALLGVALENWWKRHRERKASHGNAVVPAAR